MRLLVYPVKDMGKAKTLFSELLGVEPYADAPYYIGFRTGDLEIGLDPHGRSQGPLAYWEVKGFQEILRKLLAGGAQSDQDVKDVGCGRLTAPGKDAEGKRNGTLRVP